MSERCRQPNQHRTNWRVPAVALALFACAPGPHIGEGADGGDAGVDAGEEDAGCVPGPFDAGDTWERFCPTTEPSVRYAPAMAYDPDTQSTVLFGGGNGDVMPLGDTWEWTGESWTLPSPAASPPGREYSAMAYDSARQVAVLFGGLEWDDYCLADTWEWNGTTWTQALPASSPTARFYDAMAYDSVRGVTVLFGGETETGELLGDTWEWDGTSWTQMEQDGGTPSARILHGMVFDSARGVTVLFGGLSADARTNTALSDTWEWDGTSWTQVTPSQGPSARYYVAMAYDTTRSVTVLFGGYSGPPEDTVDGDTWTWDGTSWMQTSPAVSPAPRYAQAMAFDAQRQATVLFGGCSTATCHLSGADAGLPTDLLDDTWEWPDDE